MAIQSKELRLNNLVIYDGRYFQIHSLTPDFPYLDTMEFGFGIITWENIQPIPLTAELLESAGFKKSIGIYHIFRINTHAYFYWKESDGLGYAVEDDDNEAELYTTFPNVNSLHQLQNLIPFFTNSELPITLK